MDVSQTNKLRSYGEPCEGNVSTKASNGEYIRAFVSRVLMKEDQVLFRKRRYLAPKADQKILRSCEHQQLVLEVCILSWSLYSGVMANPAPLVQGTLDTVPDLFCLDVID